MPAKYPVVGTVAMGYVVGVVLVLVLVVMLPDAVELPVAVTLPPTLPERDGRAEPEADGCAAAGVGGKE